jgi:Bacteriophage minor capsid protein
MTPAEELTRFLAAEGIGTLAGASGWALTFSRMPDQPDESICLIDGGGVGPLVYDEEIREPAIEVRVRGKDHSAVSEKAQQIFDLLCEPGDIPGPSREIGDSLYLGIWMDSDFIDLGRDENERTRISANYRCNRQPLEANSS